MNSIEKNEALTDLYSTCCSGKIFDLIEEIKQTTASQLGHYGNMYGLADLPVATQIMLAHVFEQYSRIVILRDEFDLMFPEESEA